MFLVDNENKVKEIKSLIDRDSTLAVHGISLNGADICDTVMAILGSNGLNTNRNSNLYFNCNIVGNENNLREALSYVYSNDGKYVTLLLAIPKTIKNALREELYMGTLPNSGTYLDDKYNKDYDDFLINMFIRSTGYIPREFIVGAVIGTNTKDGVYEDFAINPRYYGLLDEDAKRRFGNQFLDTAFKEAMIAEDFYKINDITIEEIDKRIAILKRFGQNTLFFEQLREYVLNNGKHLK